jgi:hypothetical protein
VETAWKPFPYGGRRKREILTDKLSGQKYEKYDGEVKEVGNIELKDNVQTNNLYDQEDEMFDDHIDNQGNIPKLSDYPLKTEEELMDTSGTRW